jgi:hypothetical protein
MSEERFDRVEQRLDRLEVGQNELRADLRADVGRLESGQQQLRSGLEAHVSRLDGRIDDLDRHMHVLHEDVIARIAAIPEYTGPTKAEMQQGFAELREAIDRRLDPLEATVRQHTIEIERLKQARKLRQ